LASILLHFLKLVGERLIILSKFAIFDNTVVQFFYITVELIDEPVKIRYLLLHTGTVLFVLLLDILKLADVLHDDLVVVQMVLLLFLSTYSLVIGELLQRFSQLQFLSLELFVASFTFP
jgi:hypothetical protein